MAEEANPVGRPPKFKTPQELLEAANDYFNDPKGVPNKAGLLLHLGITRETWSNYRDRPEFLDALKGIEMNIENAWLQQLVGPGATGPIFYLKNAFREHYRDRVENDITTKGESISGFTYLPPNTLSMQLKPDEIRNNSTSPGHQEGNQV